MDFEGIKVSLNLPYIGSVEGNWEPNDDERKAAWEMYVELITRISVAELKPNEGLLREALTSLYSLFGTTRSILKTYGPILAKPNKDTKISFGYLAVAILNTVLRPVLAKWHPTLLDYENKSDKETSIFVHEKIWELNEELRNEINSIREQLIKYANLLSKVADVPSIIIERK